MRKLRLLAQHRQAMLGHILRCLPEEGCGLVGGRERQGCEVVPVTNMLHSPVRFSMEPLELLQALTHLEAQGLEVVAIFHSHPSGPDEPSTTDISEFNYPGAVTLIWSPNGAEWQVRAFEIDGETVQPVSLIWDYARNETCI